MLIAFIGVSETYLCCKVIPVPQVTNSVTHAFFIVFYLNYIAKSVSFVLLPENWKFLNATQNRLAYSAKGVLAKKCFPLPYATSSNNRINLRLFGLFDSAKLVGCVVESILNLRYNKICKI